MSNLELFLCGDVMTGRGVDQAFARSCPPTLHEPLVRSALEYVELAERAHGAIPRPIDHDYVWGDALGVLERKRPDVRIVNLETSITTSERAEPKGINYRMHPENVAVLSAAAIDCCVLSNNHVLDYGVDGLVETLAALEHSGIATAGAGRNLAVARAPAACDTGVGGRVLVFGLGVGDSGIPESWLAEPGRPGVHLLPDLSDSTVDSIAALVAEAKQRSDVVVASVHWGANWGYDIPVAHRRFAHGLVDRAGVDVVHGHSSHHPKAIEVHRGRPIFYGCGDFIDDYEGIPGHESFRDDLVLMYFATLDRDTARLVRLAMCPLQIHKFRLRSPVTEDFDWLQGVLDRECARFGHRVVREGDELRLE